MTVNHLVTRLHGTVRAYQHLQLVGNITGTEQCTLDDVLGTVVAIEKDGKTVIPGKGRFWYKIKPLRRYILAIYRRLPL